MQLGIIAQASHDYLPVELFSYRLDHSADAFSEQSRSYTKLATPLAYTQNEALCRQFGILPHSTLCMESALWRQQIVDRVVFDLTEDSIRINLVDGSKYHYSFEQANKILESLGTFEPQSIRTSNKPGLCHRMKQKLLLHLDSLHPLHERNARFEWNLQLLCRTTSHRLGVLKKHTRPYPLQPTLVQFELEERRAQQRSAIPIKKQSKKRRSSGSGTPKAQQEIIAAPSLGGDQRLREEVDQIISNFDLPTEDLYPLVLHLTTYRATLVDFFQSIVLPILRTELPALYSLWILQSQIRSLQKQYIHLSFRFTNILYENNALDTFESLRPTDDRLGSLVELREWCETIKALNTSSDSALATESLEQHISSSADTSLHEPSLNSGGELVDLQLPCVLSEDSTGHLTTAGHCLLNHGLLTYEELHSQSMAFARPMSMGSPDISSLSSGAMLNQPEGGSLIYRSKFDAARDRTPSLSPPSKFFSQSRRLKTSAPSIFYLPLASLEVDLLSSIESEDSRQLAIELAIKLAEECLEIQQLEDNFQVLKLLEEERECKDRFAGIGRLSSIITNARLSSGYEGSAANMAKKAIIKRALEGTKPRSVLVGGAHAQDVALRSAYQGPSRKSECRRQRAIKRKAWLAATRRLNCLGVDQAELPDDQRQVWPEPIFLKKPVLKRPRDPSESVADSDPDGTRVSDGGKRRRSKDRTSGKLKRKERESKIKRVVQSGDGFQETHDGSQGAPLISEFWLNSDSVDNVQVYLGMSSTEMMPSSPTSTDQSIDLESLDQISWSDLAMSWTGLSKEYFELGSEELRTDDHQLKEEHSWPPDGNQPQSV